MKKNIIEFNKLLENIIFDFYCNDTVTEIIVTKDQGIEIEKHLISIFTKYISKIIKPLNQQLAEKEIEIKKLEKEVDDWCHKIMQQGTNHTLELCKLKEKSNQDKISFAVERLEEVKKFNIQQVFSSKPLDDFINNQIKQLKKED